MSSSEENNQRSDLSFINRITNSGNRDLSQFLPFILNFTNRETNPDPVQDSSNLNQETQQTSPGNSSSSDRVIFINSVTQDMVVIESSSSINLDSLFNDFFNSKEGQPPASESSIEAMESIELNEFCEGSRSHIENTGGACVVCLEGWKVGQVAKEMPCKHRFHRECIEKWLKIHGSCPVCRYNMPVEDDQDGNKKNENRERRRREIWINFSTGNR